MEKSLLYLENLSMYYHGGNTVAVGLDRVTLSFNIGEFVAITGESGSGKTSLLSVISSILPFHDGELYFKGVPTSAFGDDDREEYRRSEIGFIFQNYNLINSYTAAQNIEVTLAAAGFSHAESKKRISSLLSQVGLAGLERKRASKLSAGQKQRLAIARALAKDTDIIVADEPTGNLDAENGSAIVKLLSSLSHDKLIIMVTHNYEEAAPYVTRKIKLHDGRVTADEPVVHEAPDSESESEVKAEPQKKGFTGGRIAPKGDGDRKTARRLAAMSLPARPARTVFTLAFFIFIAAASFIFFGAALSYVDDTPARIYDDDAFRNGSPRRIVFVKRSGEPISDAELDAIREISHVASVEKYDDIVDCNYYMESDVDYVYHTAVDGESNDYDSKSIVFGNVNRFILTSSALSDDDLMEGRLPEYMNEVAMYGAELGDTVDVYIKDYERWGISTYLTMTMTVTGVLSEKTDQLYFSTELGDCMYRVESGTRSELTYMFPTVEFADYYTGEIAYRISERTLRNVLLFIDPELEGNDIKLSANFHESNPFLLSKARLYGEYEEERDGIMCTLSRLKENLRPLFASSYEELAENNNLTSPEYKNQEAADLTEKYDSAYVNFSTQNVVMMSREAYYEFYGDSDVMQSVEQASLFADDYAYVDLIISDLTDAGYRAIVPYRASSIKYDLSLLSERLVSLFVSLTALIAIFVIGMLVLSMYLKTGAYDCRVLHTLGVKLSVIKRMQAYEITFYSIASLLLAAALIFTLDFLSVTQITAIVKYYRINHLLFILAANIVLAAILTYRQNKAALRELKDGGTL